MRHAPDETVPPLSELTNSPGSPTQDSAKQIENYKLQNQIGEGGMGVVWIAEQLLPVKRLVALKMIRFALSTPQAIARFEAERQAIALMNHANIARIFDGGTTSNGDPYLVMELVRGQPINLYCDSHELDINERLELFIDVCNGIQHAHQKGIIHRDLKPSNILVVEQDGRSIPKVIDFGLAKALDHVKHLTDKTMFTEQGQIVGTLQYMSPEQTESNNLQVDTRTDIYSLGAVLYQLLDGSTPIKTETAAKNGLLGVLKLIRETEPESMSQRLRFSDSIKIATGRKLRPKQLHKTLNSDLKWVVMKTIDKEPNRRYASAA